MYKLSELVYENIQKEIKAHGITIEKYNELQKGVANKANGAVKSSTTTTKEETKKEK